MSDAGWESIDRGDWARSPVKPMSPWTPGTRIPPIRWQGGNDEPEERS
jgi:hypothetical protein